MSRLHTIATYIVATGTALVIGIASPIIWARTLPRELVLRMLSVTEEICDAVIMLSALGGIWVIAMLLRYEMPLIVWAIRNGYAWKFTPDPGEPPIVPILPRRRRRNPGHFGPSQALTRALTAATTEHPTVVSPSTPQPAVRAGRHRRESA